jgi:hypothetical protein
LVTRIVLRHNPGRRTALWRRPAHKSAPRIEADDDHALAAPAHRPPSAQPGHHQRFERFTAFLDRNGLENTFTHGDGGAAFEERMRSLAFPPGIRPWNDTGIASLGARFGWLNSRVTELSADNARLKRELARAGSRATATGVPTSVYRRARRMVGRPIRKVIGG